MQIQKSCVIVVSGGCDVVVFVSLLLRHIIFTLARSAEKSEREKGEKIQFMDIRDTEDKVVSLLLPGFISPIWCRRI